MSAELIFIAGGFIFSGTIYGAVMVGGVALRMKMIEEDRSDELPGSESNG
jgi:hypothetical protein